ncbi:MAG: hypothetical protein ABR600_10820 [Actinomycetota bacterium]
MPRYMILNSHSPEECEAMEADVDKLSPALKGADFYCTCPFGEHGYYMFLEGDSSGEVLGILPDSLRLGGSTRAVQYEIWQL